MVLGVPIHKLTRLVLKSPNHINSFIRKGFFPFWNSQKSRSFIKDGARFLGLFWKRKIPILMQNYTRLSLIIWVILECGIFRDEKFSEQMLTVSQQGLLRCP